MKQAIELVKKMLKENKHDHLQSISESIYTEATLEYVLKRLEEEFPPTITPTELKCECACYQDAFVVFEVLQDSMYVACSSKDGGKTNKIMLKYEDIEKLKQFLNGWDS